MRRKLLAGIAAVAMVLAVTGAASAFPKNQRIKLFYGDTGRTSWQVNVNDSPLDTGNTGRMKVNVPEQTGDDWAGMYGNHTQLNGKLLGNVRNISFDYLPGPAGPLDGMGFHLTVPIDKTGDGLTDDYVSLSARNCPGPAIGSGWYRSDATGDPALGCAIYLNSDGTNPVGVSDGTNSAWKNFALAHPTWTVATDDVAFGILDEVGTIFVDRFATQNRMYQKFGQGTQAIVLCPNEGSC